MIRTYTKGIPKSYKEYIKRAKRKNIPFTFSLDEFNEITSKPCYYCGFEGKVGIDRINSKLGYTKDNSLSCCQMCNMMKYTYTQEEFYSHIEKILNHRVNVML